MELQIFQNSGFKIRGGLIDNEPYFVAKDVCEALSIEKYRDAVARLDDDERGSLVVDTLGGNQEMTALNESGLYSLIMTSRSIYIGTCKDFHK